MSISRVPQRQWTAGTAAWFARWTSGAADLLYPRACFLCGAELCQAGSAEQTKRNARIDRVGLCDGCRAAVIDNTPACAKCGGPLPLANNQPLDCPHCVRKKLRFDALARLGRYEGLLRSAILRTKHRHGEALGIALAKTLAAVRGEQLAGLGVDFVAPMPMHWTRRLARGTNGPEAIASALAREMSIPLKNRFLRRVRVTSPQYDLTLLQRRRNVRGAFRARPTPWLQGARVLLVDDVLTSGATANEAAKSLRLAGATFVGVAVLGRTMDS